MPESRLEFTGERVIPGLVEQNLFNEHLARYRFAARFAEHARVLDAGCGSGYGSAEMASASAVVGIDISGDAVRHARREFRRPNTSFLQASCESLPFAEASFDLVTAFEVIEHLAGWRELLIESCRVLRPSGILLVSTPNKDWYTESRAEAGPNPYHVHEFAYAEFAAALGEIFPHVQLWAQNHSETVSFLPSSETSGILDAPADTSPETAHFFLAACSQSPIPGTSAFVWLPKSGNLLRERMQHISLLESELKQKNKWLADTLDSLSTTQKAHEESNAWAASLNGELDISRAVISRLESEAAVRLEWVRDLEAQIARGRAEIERLGSEIAEKDATISERTEWARSLDREVEHLRGELQKLESEMLVRIGRRVRLLPSR